MIPPAQWCLLVSALALLTAPTSVWRWSQPSAVQGEVVEIGDQGIELRIGQEILPETIAWYDIKAIEPEPAGLGPRREVMDTAWRAHARLARADYPGALELYTRLAPSYLWSKGPQSADVSLGLAMCLIERGQRVRAVNPALSWFVASGVHAPNIASEPQAGQAAVDTQYGLMIDLPPVFVGEDRLLTIEPLPDSARITPREKLLHAYFSLALQGRDGDGVEREIEQIEVLRRQLSGRDAGAELLGDMVLARVHPDAPGRDAARKALDRRARVSSGTWVEVWARLGLGAAMIDDQDAQTRELGVIQLIHIIVRLPEVRPALTMLAARMARDELVKADRAPWGAQLMLDARAAVLAADPPTTTQEHDTND